MKKNCPGEPYNPSTRQPSGSLQLCSSRCARIAPDTLPALSPAPAPCSVEETGREEQLAPVDEAAPDAKCVAVEDEADVAPVPGRVSAFVEVASSPWRPKCRLKASNSASSASHAASSTSSSSASRAPPPPPRSEPPGVRGEKRALDAEEGDRWGLRIGGGISLDDVRRRRLPGREPGDAQAVPADNARAAAVAPRELERKEPLRESSGNSTAEAPATAAALGDPTGG
mmetsp:Transcript_128305/g.371432  ORF Transcript_128305/g.371432 Transcript_128305/m.371432 type:complete len:228 (+) Transcript_128305:117-800(+)